MVKEIVHDEEQLSQAAEPATAEDAAIAQDLVETLESLGEEECVMLAANQIGANKAIIVFLDDNDKVHVLYNPKIKQAMRPYKVAEGCLSLDYDNTVTRYQTIKITYDELVDGELVPRQKQYRDFDAQKIQHGIDHCRGRLV